jgi:hypothetical protein
MNKLVFKIAILGILIFLITNESKAQGNLQFNKVKLVSASDTVPTNKVWKIEGISYPYLVYTNNAFFSRIEINGVTSATRIYSNIVIWEMKYPFWLPAGSTLAASTNVINISIIEYNIIP